VRRNGPLTDKYGDDILHSIIVKLLGRDEMSLLFPFLAADLTLLYIRQSSYFYYGVLFIIALAVALVFFILITRKKNMERIKRGKKGK
jgi:hypothetical protein